MIKLDEKTKLALIGIGALAAIGGFLYYKKTYAAPVQPIPTPPVEEAPPEIPTPPPEQPPQPQFTELSLDLDNYTIQTRNTGRVTSDILDSFKVIKMKTDIGYAAIAYCTVKNLLFNTGSYSKIIVEFDALTSSDLPFIWFSLSALDAGYTGSKNTIGYGYTTMGDASGLRTWHFATTDSDGKTEIDKEMPGLDVNQWHTLRFEISGNGGIAKCFFDGIQIGTNHITSLPNINEYLRIWFGVYNSSSYKDFSSYIKGIRILLI